MSEIIIGIDLGTTNSEVAVERDGRIEVIPVEHGKILPSVVGISESGEVLVGEPAKNQYVSAPERTIKSIKRLMGSDEQILLAEQHFTPQEISAMILKRLKQIAEEYLGEPVEKAVITVPAYFSDAQRLATQEAGAIAGLDVVRMINEPTAASLVYEADCQAHKRVMVYDLGGGTFDVSVVDIEQAVVEVLSSHGDNQLGGDDFDQKIVEFIVQHLQADAPLDIPSKAMARIIRAAEQAKIALSDAPFVMIEEAYLLEHNGAPIHLSLELSRDDYEKMITPFLDQTLDALHIALKGAKLTVSDIEEIILVGGATRTPLIANRLRDELKLEPLSEVDPDLCVATGAAIQAAMIAGRQVVDTVLVDVTPYTFGTNAISELNGEPYPYCFIPIIHKNTAIPVTKSEVFFTAYDGQKTVDITVYQGEDPDALNNISIGQYSITGLKNAQQGNPIITTFMLDINGILHISTKEKDTGLEKKLVIQNAISRFEEGDLDEARSRIDQLFETDDTTPQTDADASGNIAKAAQSKAQNLVQQAQNMLEKVSVEDQEDIIDFIETINDALSNDDVEALHTGVESLTDVIYYLET